MRNDSLWDTVAEYNRSAALLQTRIDQINQLLQSSPHTLAARSQLRKRRLLLYTQLAHLRQAVRQMHSYCARHCAPCPTDDLEAM